MYLHLDGDLATITAVQLGAPVLLTFKKLTLTERKLSDVEQYMVCFAHVLHKFPGVFYNLTEIHLMLPQPEMVCILQDRQVSTKIKAKLIDL